MPVDELKVTWATEPLRNVVVVVSVQVHADLIRSGVTLVLSG